MSTLGTRTLAGLVLLFWLAACSSAPRGGKDVLLVHGGTIYLGAPDWRTAEALLVEDGRVREVGRFAALEQLAGPGARHLDLGGGVALPGLQDAHGHVEGLGKSLESVDLRGAASYAELIERVALQAARQPPGTWIEGRGWDQNRWPDKRFPHHRELSARVPAHPVLLERVDGHAVLVNLKALELAGLDKPQSTAEPVSGGHWMLDEEGRLAGVLVDAACALVERHRPAPDAATRERWLLRAQAELLALGLTCVHDMGVDLATVRLYERLRDEGRLKLRVIAYLGGDTALKDEDLAGFPLAPDARERFSVPGVKYLIDGALGSRGAALLEDYSDDPANRGLLQFPPEELERRVALCARHGLQPAIHAIGDRGNRLVLEAYERRIGLDPGFAALRPRVEHAQVVAESDWPRFARLGIVPSMQPTHATSDMPWAPARLGPERTRGAYAWTKLDPSLAALAFGSDFPVERPHPLEGVYAARTTCARDGQPPQGFKPEERLDARAALAGFTLGAARAVRQERTRGRLAAGYAADLTVLDRDPLRVPPQELLQARVLLTVVDGEVVHRVP